MDYDLQILLRQQQILTELMQELDVLNKDTNWHIQGLIAELVCNSKSIESHLAFRSVQNPILN